MVNEMFRDYPTKETTGRELGGARSSIPPARHSSYCRNRLHVTVESCHLDTWYLASSGSRTFSYCAVLSPRHSSYCRNRLHVTVESLPPRHVVSSELGQSHILVLCDTVAKTQQLLPQSITPSSGSRTFSYCAILSPRHSSYCRNRLHVTVESCHLDTWYLASSGSRTFSYCAVLSPRHSSYCRNRLHVTIESLPPRHVVSSELWQSHILVLCDTVAKTQQLLPQSITRDHRVLPPRHVVSSELWQSHILVLCDTVAKTQQLLPQSITRDRRVLPPRHVVSSGLWQSHILVLCDTVAKTQQLLPQSITPSSGSRTFSYCAILSPRHSSYCRNRLHVTVESLPPRHVVSSELWQSHILVLCDTVAKTQQLLPPRHSSYCRQDSAATAAKTQQLLSPRHSSYCRNRLHVTVESCHLDTWYLASSGSRTFSYCAILSPRHSSYCRNRLHVTVESCHLDTWYLASSGSRTFSYCAILSPRHSSYCRNRLHVTVESCHLDTWYLASSGSRTFSYCAILSPRHSSYCRQDTAATVAKTQQLLPPRHSSYCRQDTAATAAIDYM
ncbi:hypothetical protein J6590_018926 [Homalodisca vitripennis]|nr:hypothetical protein J6590_018926 [Homalodisca vitripennis]